VIIQERRDVEPLVPSQQKREQIRLPQLVRLGSLEASRERLLARLRGSTFAQAFRVQHSAHRRGRGPDA
jgi:hypothetical protein